jgi:glycosyltransferase involved in cell wall biosynthesis
VKLGFDASSLTAEGKGLARFQGEFLRELARLRLVDDLTVFAPLGASVPAVDGWRHVDVPPGSMLLWEQLRLPRLASAYALDVVVTTSERCALWGPPQVVYVYEHPRRRARRSRDVGVGLRQRLVDFTTVLLFRASMRHARVVLAASRSTAADLAPLVTARVVPSAASAEFSPGGSVADYLLHLASDDPRDNSEMVIDALAELASTGDRPRLVIAGPVRAARPALEQRAKALGVDGQIHWRGFLRGPELVELYRGAIAYVDPSLYEGFGLQALEALSCGTPAVVFATTSLPEVVGDGGILVPPGDVSAFGGVVRRLLHEPGLRDELSRLALAQASQFSWERTVRETLAVCAELAGTPPPGAEATP